MKREHNFSLLDKIVYMVNILHLFLFFIYW